MKSLKTMWAPIAVLDHNYKKFVDNQSGTGRGRKVFEFANEMIDLYEKKKTVHPTLLLDGQTINIPSEEQAEKQNKEPINQQQTNINKKESELVRKRNLKRKRTILEDIREDRLKYQKERLQLLRESHEKIVGLLQEKNNLEKERIDVERQRNDILKNQS
ncbi:hypothetical protein ABEB36_009445 [Hypothenemus hampei]|uniref:Uncharacterized protein n=1 Tax=Hypothenemus hampei TaxID=57062 RepID=A0ABD1EGL2_HYPHA